MARFIFVTGGVVSSLGKGLSSASLAYLLKSQGYKVRLKNFYSGLNIIQIKNKLFGGSDHRREGIAIGN